VVSFLRPASASSPTSQAPRSSATNGTPAVFQSVNRSATLAKTPLVPRHARRRRPVIAPIAASTGVRESRSVAYAPAHRLWHNRGKARQSAALCACARRLRFLSVAGFPSAAVLGWQSSRLATDYMGMTDVAPCPWRSTLFAADEWCQLYAEARPEARTSASTIGKTRGSIKEPKSHQLHHFHASCAMPA
jgi:hypothetical protein